MPHRFPNKCLTIYDVILTSHKIYYLCENVLLIIEMATETSTIVDNITDVHPENPKTSVDLKETSSPKESTRRYIAQLYVWAFFVVILLVFVVGFLKCFSINDYKDLLVTISGILSGPLGFIVGYYFKASKE